MIYPDNCQACGYPLAGNSCDDCGCTIGDPVKKPLPPNPVAGCEVILYGNDPVIEIARDKSTLLMIDIKSYPFTKNMAYELSQYLKACLERGNDA